MRAVPRWVRFVRFVDRVITTGFQAYEALRDAVLIAYVDPSHHNAVTHLAYAREPQPHIPGSVRFEGGLFSWERTGLEAMGVGPGAAVLLGGAGGGRELLGLIAMGCRVLAFEPDPRLAEIARRLVAGSPSASVHCASYADFVEQARRRQGPLMEFAAGARAVVLGWGSFAHLTIDGDRTALLSALRSVAPEASVLLSFPLRSREDDGMGARRARSLLGSTFERLGGRPRVAGLTYFRRRGFVQRFLPEDIYDVAQRTGYTVERLEHNPFGHAVLMPQSEGVQGTRTVT